MKAIKSTYLLNNYHVPVRVKVIEVQKHLALCNKNILEKILSKSWLKHTEITI